MSISKNWLKTVAIAMICSITYVSCDNNENEDMVFGDFNPLNIDIMIVDEEGTNLLDPTVEGNWMDQPFQMTCLKDTYETSWIGDPILNIPPPSRLYVAYFHGLRCEQISVFENNDRVYYENKYKLVFGEFQGDEHQDLSMTFHVPYIETTYNIKVEYRFYLENYYDAYHTTRIWVDGKEVDSRPIKIVLPRRQTQPTQ